MPSAARRRRPHVEDDSDDEVTQSTSRTPSTQRPKRAPVSDEEDEDDEGGEDEADEMDVDIQSNTNQQIVKKMVRYALACEYQRQPIRRTGITEKVIGKQRGAFKRAFEGAQKELETKFGMQMVEVPFNEKVTLREKRAAQKSKGKSKGQSNYILTTILPTKYRTAEIMPPSIVGDQEEEAAYVGLCSIIVSIVALTNGGQIPEHKLSNYLQRLNLEHNTGLGSTAALLKKMATQGYIQRVIEKNADEETVDYRLGGRGKVEIGNKGVRGLVLEVYGDSAPEDLDQRLQRSLGMEVKRVDVEERQQQSEEREPEDGDPGPSTSRRSRR